MLYNIYNLLASRPLVVLPTLVLPICWQHVRVVEFGTNTAVLRKNDKVDRHNCTHLNIVT